MLRKVLMFNEAASKKHLDFFYGKKEAKKEDSPLSSIYRVIQLILLCPAVGDVWVEQRRAGAGARLGDDLATGPPPLHQTVHAGCGQHSAELTRAN